MVFAVEVKKGFFPSVLSLQRGPLAGIYLRKNQSHRYTLGVWMGHAKLHDSR